jgi:hypothetical protein
MDRVIYADAKDAEDERSQMKAAGADVVFNYYAEVGAANIAMPPVLGHNARRFKRSGHWLATACTTNTSG